MKTYVLVSGTVFALFAAMAFFIIFAHWGSPESNLWFVLLHSAIGICLAALALWAFRLNGRLGTTAA
jgi:hypothetical protein